MLATLFPALTLPAWAATTVTVGNTDGIVTSADVDAANGRANQAVVENFPVHSFDNALNRKRPA